MANGSVGGQSRVGPGGRARYVLVTPSGQEVGSADPTRGRTGGSSRSRQTPQDVSAQIEAEAAARERAKLEAARERTEAAIKAKKEREIERFFRLREGATRAFRANITRADIRNLKGQMSVYSQGRNPTDIPGGIAELIGTTAAERKAQQSLIEGPRRVERRKIMKFLSKNLPEIIDKVERKIPVTGNFNLGELRDAIKKERDKKVENIQKKLKDEKITQEQAEKEIIKANKGFQTKLALVNIPTTAVKTAALTRVPLVGGLFILDSFLRRKALMRQIKDFPTASAINVAASLAGGLVGARRTDPKIESTNIQAVTNIVGKEKQKLIDKVEQGYNPDFRISQQKGKITNTLAYEVKTADGRTIQVLEFVKSTPGKKSTRGERQFIGVEMRPDIKRGSKAESFVIGSTRERQKGKITKSTTKVFRLYQRNKREASLFRRFRKRAEVIRILEKSKLRDPRVLSKINIKGRQIPSRMLSKDTSLAKITSLKTLRGKKRRQAFKLVRRIRKGKNISTKDIKKLINLKAGKNIFSKKDFKKALTAIKTKGLTISTFKGGRFSRTKIKPAGERKIGETKYSTISRAISKEAQESVKNIIEKRKVKNIRKDYETFLRKAPIVKSTKVAIQRKITKREALNQERLRVELLPKMVGGGGKGRSIHSGARPSSSVILAVAVRTSSGKRYVPIGPRALINLKSGEVVLPSRSSAQIGANFIRAGELSSVINLQNQTNRLNNKYSNALANISEQRLRQQSLTKQKQLLSQVQRMREKMVMRQKMINKRLVRSSSRRFLGRRIRAIGNLDLSRNRRGKIGQKKIGYRVFGKARNRYVRLSKLPLTKRYALDRGAYAIDNTTSRTFRIRPAGRTNRFGSIAKRERGHFLRNRRKFRDYRLRNRRVNKLANNYIERIKYGIDSRGEKRGLSLARYMRTKRRNLRRRGYGGGILSSRGGIFG